MNILEYSRSQYRRYNSKCWNTLNIQEYSNSQKLEISRNSKLYCPAGKIKDKEKDLGFDP